MAKRRSSRTTLERKSRLIFGLCILFTVGACLWWPWWQMERLARSGDPDQARVMARAFLLSRHAIKFAAGNAEREQLDRFGVGKGDTGPELIHLPPGAPGQPQGLPGSLPRFQREAVKVFLKHPKEGGYWQTSGDTFMYAQALRAEGECLTCHNQYQPGELIGAVTLKLDLAERHSTLLANRLILVAAALVVVGASMAIVYALFRYMVVKPVLHLKDVTDRVSEGDRQVRSEIDTGNELEVLSDALNHMLDELAKTEAELREATATRDAKLDELAKANVALFEANQVKNKFVATMSHEFRTPLNSILGFAQVLNESPGIKDDPKLRRYTANILSSGRMLLEMIDDLLDLAKVEAGRLQVRCEKVVPKDLIEATCSLVRPLLAETELALTHDVDPATPLMQTDATKVQQILYNLLSNAIKFTAEGEVRVTVRPTDDQQVVFAVSDTGPGIGRDQQLRVFDRFTQLDSSYTRRYRGTGLGLSIVKELTGLLGGTVSVDSEVGKGSTFTVTLPVDSTNAAGRAPGHAAAPREVPEAAAESEDKS